MCLLLSRAQFFVLTTSRHVYPHVTCTTSFFSFVTVTCVPVVSFLASRQGMTRYHVGAEAPLGLL